MKVYTSSEVNKLIKAFQEKYKISGCDQLPYYPEAIDVQLFAIENYPPSPGGGILLKPSEKHPNNKMEFIEPIKLKEFPNES